MQVYVTIGGKGLRMKPLSPLEKHQLHIGDKKILEHIFDVFPDAKLIGHKKTNSRQETLSLLAGEKDCLIVDCDVIPIGFSYTGFETDVIFSFRTNKEKYCSLITENGKLAAAFEGENFSHIKSSGVYFLKSIDATIKRMTNPNSIASGMIGAKVLEEDTFLRVGDVEDYYEAL